MELMFEARTNLRGFDGKIRFIQCRPRIHPEPVLCPDGAGDGKGVSLYGSVLPEGGKLRMWYYAVPRSVEGVSDGNAVAYAESDNGIDWHKPDLHVPGHVANLTNLGMHSATVFIDPDSSASHRYRATGRPKREGHGMCHPVKQDGYFTAHSADGWNWSLDSDEPRWKSGDVITSVYHPGRRSGLVAMKYTPRWMRLKRRCIHTAVFQNGDYADDVSALYPDEFDDQCAAMRGFHSCDYYGMGMLPAGRATVGFVWKYWHELPYTNLEGSSARGLYGASDVSLVYQPDPGGRWLHLPGRPVFIDRESLPWTRGWINTASNVVEVGDQHRLYYSGRIAPHGHGLDEHWAPTAEADATFRGSGITFAYWPKWRLFGFEAMPEGRLRISLGRLAAPAGLTLNYETTAPDGYIRVQLARKEGIVHDFNDCEPLRGSALAGPVRWRKADVIPAGDDVSVCLDMRHARIYAYELKPVK